MLGAGFVGVPLQITARPVQAPLRFGPDVPDACHRRVTGHGRVPPVGPNLEQIHRLPDNRIPDIQPGADGLGRATNITLFLDHPGTPIAWLPVVWRDGQHQEFIIAVQVHDRKWKPPREYPAGAVSVRGSHIRKFSCNRDRLLNDRRKALAELRADVGVVPNLPRQLGQRGLVESNAHHRSRRRTSANTSSAGMRFAVPASISAIRLRISSSQAASTSPSGSWTVARSSSANRTRSAGGNARACERSSSMRWAILIPW